MLQLKLDEQSEITFDLEIAGSQEKPTDIRYIIESANFNVVCKVDIDATGFKVKVPRLKNILESGIHNSKLEVVLENKLFTPIQETIMFEETIVVQAIPKQETVVEVKAATLPIITVTPTTVQALPEIDTSWKETGFKSLKNPF